MKTIWTVLGLIVLGNAFFVLPLKLSSNSISTDCTLNYKRDTILLQDAFPDTTIRLVLNMPPNYEAIYNGLERKTSSATDSLHVNVLLSHNVGFTALAFPFYKSSNFNASITFQSIINNTQQQGADSVALIGHIDIFGKLRILGICSPLEARKLVEKELVAIVHKESKKIEADINHHLQVTFPEPIGEEPIITTETNATKKQKVRTKKTALRNTKKSSKKKRN
jgi:hypothetical protein